MPLICINDLCHMYEWMRHLTRRNERVMSHVRTSHVAQLRWMNRVILMNESCHTAQACRQREPGAEERKPSVRWAPGLARAMQSAPREGVRHICANTHLYVCLRMCAVTYSCVPWLVHMGLARAMQGAPREGVRHTIVVICTWWLIHMCAVTHSCVCHDSVMCAVTHLYRTCSSNAACN